MECFARAGFSHGDVFVDVIYRLWFLFSVIPFGIFCMVTVTVMIKVMVDSPSNKFHVVMQNTEDSHKFGGTCNAFLLATHRFHGMSTA